MADANAPKKRSFRKFQCVPRPALPPARFSARFRAYFASPGPFLPSLPHSRSSCLWCTGRGDTGASWPVQTGWKVDTGRGSEAAAPAAAGAVLQAAPRHPQRCSGPRVCAPPSRLARGQMERADTLGGVIGEGGATAVRSVAQPRSALCSICLDSRERGASTSCVGALPAAGTGAGRGQCSGRCACQLA